MDHYISFEILLCTTIFFELSIFFFGTDRNDLARLGRSQRPEIFLRHGWTRRFCLVHCSAGWPTQLLYSVIGFTSKQTCFVRTGHPIFRAILVLSIWHLPIGSMPLTSQPTVPIKLLQAKCCAMTPKHTVVRLPGDRRGSGANPDIFSNVNSII